jgi:hypothetical protein
LPSAETRAVEERLQSLLGTRVLISKEAGGRGKISIEFFSDEELYGITAKLMTFPDSDVSSENGGKEVGAPADSVGADEQPFTV